MEAKFDNVKQLFLILNFWHEVFNIKMAPKIISPCHKFSKRFGKMAC